MQYWLIKSEPHVYSISDLQADGATIWDGVRNYQARNFLRQMEVEDLAFFYHSNTKTPGIVGLARIVAANLDDPTQFDAHSPYYDPKSTRTAPRWQTVKVEFVESLPTIITLQQLKQEFKADEFLLVKKGNRLSVMPVAADVANKILKIKHTTP